MVDTTSLSTHPPELAASEGRRALAAWYLRNMHRAVWMLPLWVVLLVVLWLLLLSGIYLDPHEQIVSSREAALALKPPMPPDGDNAAPDYNKAFASFVQWNQPKDEPTVVWSLVASAYFERPEVMAHLAANESYISQLLQASSKPACNFDLDYSQGMGMLMVHLARMRNGARQLVIDARTQAHAGRHTASVVRLQALRNMARHAETDPVLISSLVSIAMEHICLMAIESIMQHDPPGTVEELEVYRNVLKDWPDPMRRAETFLDGERKMSLYSLDQAAAQNTLLSNFTPIKVPEEMLLPWYGSDRACLDEVLKEMLERARSGDLKDNPQVGVETLIEKHRKGPVFLTRGIVPVLERTHISFIRCHEQRLVTDAALAFLQYRLRHGKDAKALEALVPEFLPRVPVDYYHGAPLRMRVDPDGMTVTEPLTYKAERRFPGLIRIYGLGANGADNQGFANMANPQERLPTMGINMTHDDPVFRVPPAARNAEDAAEELAE